MHMTQFRLIFGTVLLLNDPGMYILTNSCRKQAEVSGSGGELKILDHWLQDRRVNYNTRHIESFQRFLNANKKHSSADI